MRWHFITLLEINVATSHISVVASTNRRSPMDFIWNLHSCSNNYCTPRSRSARSMFWVLPQETDWVQDQLVALGQPRSCWISEEHTNAGAHLQPRAVPNLMSSYQDTEEDSALEINSITQGYTYSGQRQARANQHDYSRVSIMLIRTLTFGRAFWFASVASDSKHLSPSVLCRPELVSLPSPPDQRVTDGWMEGAWLSWGYTTLELRGLAARGKFLYRGRGMLPC